MAAGMTVAGISGREHGSGSRRSFPGRISARCRCKRMVCSIGAAPLTSRMVLIAADSSWHAFAEHGGELNRFMRQSGVTKSRRLLSRLSFRDSQNLVGPRQRLKPHIPSFEA